MWSMETGTYVHLISESCVESTIVIKLPLLVYSCRAELQVRTTQDYCTDSWIWYFLSGGLNHQTAHHLFPGKQSGHRNKYRNLHYFRSQIFHVRNFRVAIFSSISRVCHIFTTYNIRVRNFHRFGWNENFLTTKILQITVSH